MININDFQKFKKEKKKISMITCYDFWTAQIINQTEIDTILVGDSLAMVMHGHDSTIPADSDLIALHTNAVRKGAPNKFIIADIPFLHHRKGKDFALNAVEKLMKAGANAVKLEGIIGHEDTVRHIVQSGIPVMGHLGLTPQSVHQFGGHKVQGREQGAIDSMLQQAKLLQEMGSFAIVLECVPANIAKAISETIDIPTIGIGAGADVDGQVLVLQDMLGMNNKFNPKFLRKYMNGFEMISNSLNQFHNDVTSSQFPTQKESY